MSELWIQVISMIVVGGVMLLALRTMQGRYYSYLDQRFKTLEDKTSELGKKVDAQQQAHAELCASLPTQYIGRDDWIRFSTTIDAKLDALHRENVESERRIREEIHRPNTEIEQRLSGEIRRQSIETERRLGEAIRRQSVEAEHLVLEKIHKALSPPEPQ